MTITTHPKLRRVLQWKYPGEMLEMTEAWNGTEAIQDFLDRAATWSGTPITATQITDAEAEYDARNTNPTVLSFGDFVDRFTALERAATLKIINKTDLVTGEPTNPNLQELYDRAKAANKVDLEAPSVGTFLDALITAGVIDAARKTAILTP